MYYYKTKILISVKTMQFKFNDCNIRCHFKKDGKYTIISIGIKNKRGTVENWISKIALYNHTLHQYEIETILIENPPFRYFAADLLKDEKSNFRKMYNTLFNLAVNSKNESNEVSDVQKSIREYHSMKNPKDKIPKLYYWHDFDRGKNNITPGQKIKIEKSFWATKEYLKYLEDNNRNVRFTNSIEKASVPVIYTK
jgi:hypothetical protein